MLFVGAGDYTFKCQISNVLLGYAALFVTGIKGLITLAVHSSMPWDKPFYKYKVLHPVAWVLEQLISTPATHHAHHADNFDDGIGN